jgi:ankyrin repeat protein
LIDCGAAFDQLSTWDRGHTPLGLASWWGHLDIVKVLLEHGAQVNSQSYGAETPLYNAARVGHLEVVKVLIAHGASVNACVKWDNSTFNCIVPRKFGDCEGVD